jgi:hypothetical protein
MTPATLFFALVAIASSADFEPYVWLPLCVLAAASHVVGLRGAAPE